ncbi:agmatinase [[Eubacterium] cellulosolvens]
MGLTELLFADATTNFDESEVVILGVPFDGTSSHRPGSASAPAAIRRESYNFETWLPKYGFDIETVKIHDFGDIKDCTKIQNLINRLPNKIHEIITKQKFLITLGGEHSLTVPIIKTILEGHNDQPLGVVIFDAHLDFRDSYLEEKYSHACACRRITEIVGLENVVVIGIRSYSKEEADSLRELMLRFYDADMVMERGIDPIINEALDYLGKKKIYLSIDIDVVDPAYAPGVGNPEYFGLTPEHLRRGIELLAPYLIGADIVEVSPPYDTGNTAALAAQLVQIIIAQAIINSKNDAII